MSAALILYVIGVAERVCLHAGSCDHITLMMWCDITSYVMYYDPRVRCYVVVVCVGYHCLQLRFHCTRIQIQIHLSLPVTSRQHPGLSRPTLFFCQSFSLGPSFCPPVPAAQLSALMHHIQNSCGRHHYIPPPVLAHSLLLNPHPNQLLHSSPHSPLHPTWRAVLAS